MTADENRLLSERIQRFHQHLLEISKDDLRANIDLLRLYPETDDWAALRGQIDDLKKCLDSFRPLETALVNKLEEHYNLRYTYDSNRIEGNTLSYQETYLVVNKGLTIGGKTLREHLEVVNHQEAIYAIYQMAKNQRSYNEDNLLFLHQTILSKIEREYAGRYRNIRVYISGSRYTPPNPLKVHDLMQDYFHQYAELKQKAHPIELAAFVHQELVNIHPFVDGNGRAARLAMNLTLLQNGYPITNISSDSKNRMVYYDVLENYHETHDSLPFKAFIAKSVKATLIEYLQSVATSISADDHKGKGKYFFEKIESVFS